MKDKTNNYVAKYARQFNKAQTMTDRKKAKKKGYRKHKGARYEDTSIDETTFHVRLDHLDGDARQKKASSVLKKHETSGNIKYVGSTDKGALFKAKSRSHADRIHRELKPHATGVEVTENFVVVKSDGDGEGTVKTYPTRQAARAHANKENKKKHGSHKAMSKKHLEEPVKEGWYPDSKGEEAHLRWDVMTGSTPKQLSDKYGMTVNQAKNQILKMAKKDGFHVGLTGKDDGKGYRDTWMQVAQMIASHGSAAYKKNVMKHAHQLTPDRVGSGFEVADRADVTKMPKKPFTFRKAKFHAYNVFSELEQISKGKTLWSPEMKEGKNKGLWDNIHAKRKRGEKPAKPGEKGYPKTLDVGEGLAQARKNVGADKCWDGYKAKGTKMKGGKEVPNCEKEGYDNIQYKKTPKLDPKKTYTGPKKSEMSKRMARGQRNDPVNKIGTKHYRNESTDAYGKSQDAIRSKKQRAGMTSSDQHKMGAVADMMRREREKRAMKKEDAEERARLSLRHAQEKETLKKTQKRERDSIKSEAMSPESQKAHRNMFKSGAKKQHDAQAQKEREARLKAKGWVKNDRGGMSKVSEANSGDYTVTTHKTKDGHRAKVTGPGGKEMYLGSKTYKSAKHAHGEADTYHKAYFKRGGSDRAATNAVHSYRSKHESVMVNEELSALEKRKYANLKRRVKSGDRAAKKQLDKFEKDNASKLNTGSAAKAKKVGNFKKGVGDIHTGQGYTGTSSEKGSDDALVMQLRKAQDMNGNHAIKFTGGQMKLPKQLIDKLLNTYNKLSKPQDKKKFVTMLTHELRKRSGKTGPKQPPSKSDKAYAAFSKRKGIQAPKGRRSSGPSNKDLMDIERGL